MQKYDTLNDAIALAKFAHFKQKDKAGFDYFKHPERVLAAVQAQGAPPYVQMAAVLHDVTEDTKFTPNMLRDLGFSEAVVGLIELLDRNEARRMYDGIVYDARYHPRLEEMARGSADKDEFYYRQIRTDSWARKIKLADVADNTLTYRLAYLDVETRIKSYHKYAKALRLLNFEENLGLADTFYFPQLKELENV